MTPPDILDRLARRFRDFAAHDGQDDVLYAAMANVMAENPSLCGLLAEAPPTQHLPVLLLAAVHDRILDTQVAQHPLHAYYPTAGGGRLPDGELAAALEDFVGKERTALVQTLRTRTTQTNEIGRCAVLRMALQALQALQMSQMSQTLQTMPTSPVPQRLALFDFGCSAGLNLSVDRYGYDDGWHAEAGLDATVPVITSRWRRPPPEVLRGPRRWTIVDRHGVDLSPIDAADVAATRWLCACVWPHDRERGERLRQAIELTRRHPPRLVKSTAGLGELTRWLDALPPDVQPVLINTWVLAYFDPEGRQAYFDAVATLVRERGLAWISAEAGKFAPLAQLPAASEHDPAATTTLWTLQWRDAGQLRTEALAWSHAHGKWVDWLR